MPAHVINGEQLAAELRAEVETAFEELTGRGVRPGLATVLVGDDYASMAYERRVRRLAEELGCYYDSEVLDPNVQQAEALGIVGKLNLDPRISGTLILRPLPPQLSEAELFSNLDPLKDVEAVHPENAGLLALGQPRFIPSTPASIFHLLDRYVVESGRDPATFYNGLDLVLIGRSNNVGKPALWLGLARGATVVSAHHFTALAGRLEAHTRHADIIIVAAGVAGLLNGEMVKEGVIVIDVGINPVKDPETGRTHMVGDVDFDSVAEKAEALTPVPGGVGPITDVWLLKNTLDAAKFRARI